MQEALKRLKMDIRKRLKALTGNTAILLVAGLLLLVFVSLIFLVAQQRAKRAELNVQISKVNRIISIPVTGAEKLRAEYEEAYNSIPALTTDTAFEMLVGIARESGIDTSEDGKISIPPVAVKNEKVGQSSYKVLSFQNVNVQDDYAKVMAFISRLESSKTTKTIVLKKLSITRSDVKGSSKQAENFEVIANLDIDIYTRG